MEIRKAIRAGELPHDEVNHYITQLEEALLSFNGSNIKKLIIALDVMAGKMADDMKRTTNSDIDKMVKMIGQMKNLKIAYDVINDMKPKEVTPQQTAEETYGKINPVRRIS